MQALLSALPSHGVHLLAYAHRNLDRPSPSVGLPFCVPAAFGGFCARCPSRPRFSRISCARSWEPGLRPLVDLATRCFSDHPTVINARVSESVSETE